LDYLVPASEGISKTGVLGRVRNSLTEYLARERVVDLARAAEAARLARGNQDVRPEGIIATVRILLAQRRGARVRTNGSSSRRQPRHSEPDYSASRGST
jgi:hypothetical protein